MLKNNMPGALKEQNIYMYKKEINYGYKNKTYGPVYMKVGDPRQVQ